MDHKIEVALEEGLADLEHRIIIAPIPSTASEKTNARVRGSFRQAYSIDTFISYTTRSAFFSVISPVIKMQELPLLLKGLFVSSPMISNMLVILPMNWIVNRTGGKSESMVLIGLSSLGMIAATTLSAIIDLQTINGFDWRYGLMLGSGLLTGLSSGALPLITDALKWAPKKEYIPDLQLLYSFLVDSTGVTTPLAVYFLSGFGFYIPFAIYTALGLSGGLLTYAMVHASPYLQLKTRFAREQAKDLAIQSGQLAELIKDDGDISFWTLLADNFSVLRDRRSILLCFSVFSSLGNVFIIKTFFPGILIGGFGLGLTEAVVTSALATLISLIVRPIASKLILKFDNESGGIHFHLLGCTIIFSGAMVLATVKKLPQWALFFSLACTSIGYGISMVTPLSIATKWSKPVAGNLKEINPSTMFNLFGTIGSIGGIILPMLLNLLVAEQGAGWYSQFFYIILGLMLVSAVGTLMVDYQVRPRPDCRFFKNTRDFFRREEIITNQTPVATPASLNALPRFTSADDEVFVNAIL